jgi:hypothetical protein
MTVIIAITMSLMALSVNANVIEKKRRKKDRRKNE